MYTSDLTNKTIVEEIEDIYGFEVSESMISDITDKVVPRIEEWKSRSLDSVYPVIYIDAVHFSVKDAGIVKKRAAYVILGVTTEGMKEVLGLYVLDSVYPVIYIDAVHFSVKDAGIVKKRAAYVILGVTTEGMKEVLGLYVGDSESSKYWLSVFNELKNRGLKDIMILCADELIGIKESINVAFPNTKYQRCIVHQVRNTLKYVSYKDKK